MYARHVSSQGIYILGNDAAYEQFVTAVNSIRAFDSTTPICLIPYDEHTSACAAYLAERNGFVFEHEEILSWISTWSRRIHERRLAIPGTEQKLNRLRKLAAWFGPFEHFLYMDADVIVLCDTTPFMRHLDTYDFLINRISSLHWERGNRSRGFRYVFNADIYDEIPFSRLKYTFGSNMWFSRKHLFTYGELENILEEVLRKDHLFDFDAVIDQPIINYIVLKPSRRVGNLADFEDISPFSMPDERHFEIDGGMATFEGKKLAYIHAARDPVQKGNYCYPLWHYYRTLQQPEKTRRRWLFI